LANPGAFMIPTGSINKFQQQLQSLSTRVGGLGQLEGRISALEKAVAELVQITFHEEDAQVDGALSLEQKTQLIEQYDQLPTAEREGWYQATGVKKGQIVAWKRLKTQGRLA
jgi:hypothetical protein